VQICLGAGCRRFESCHSDQILNEGDESPSIYRSSGDRQESATERLRERMGSESAMACHCKSLRPKLAALTANRAAGEPLRLFISERRIATDESISANVQ